MFSVPRLEELCRIQVSLAHANEVGVKKEILKVSLFDSEKFKDVYNWFEAMETEISLTLQRFPPRIRKMISIPLIIKCLLKSREWANFYEKNFDLAFDFGYYFLRSSFFTSEGILKEGKLMREILKNAEIKSSVRFCIACYLCFPDLIDALWEQLPEDERPKIENGVYKHGLGIGGDNKMVELWSQFLLGDFQNNLKCGISFSFYIFTKSLGNYVSFKNCFEVLNRRERCMATIFLRSKFEKILRWKPVSELFLPFQPPVDILAIFLTHLGQGQLEIFFQTHQMLYLGLYNLLSWPYQRSFMLIVNRIWELLSKSIFCLLLYRIMRLMTDKLSSKFCDYRPILKEFWMQSPSSYKSFFLRSEGRYSYRCSWEDWSFEPFRRQFIKEYEKFDRFVIIYLNSPSFTIEDEKIFRLIFGSATLEQKSFIVATQGPLIGDLAFETGDLKRIDLFIECFLPKEDVRSFKRKLVNYENVKKVLCDLIASNKQKILQENLNWALCGEDIKEFQRNLLEKCLRQNDLLYSFNSLECIDNFMKSNLTSCEIKVMMKSIKIRAFTFAERYNSILLEGDFKDIDFYLNWRSSSIDINKFRRDLAFNTIRYIDYSYASKGLSHVKNFVRWAKLSHEDCTQFKKLFAFNRSVIKYYSECVAETQLSRTDVFIQWAELTDTETKDYKQNLVFNGRKVFSECVCLILNGKSSLVAKLVNWAQLSEEKVKEFYSNLPMEVDLYFQITERKIKLANVKKFFTGFPLSEQEIKRYKNNWGLKSANVIEYYLENNKWKEADELLSWCFSSSSEVNQFKSKIPFKISKIYLNLILDMRLDDVDKFFTWTGINIYYFKAKFLRNALFNNNFYEMVTTMFVENKNELERLLNWLLTYNSFLRNWKDNFLSWCRNKVEGICFYSDCRSKIIKKSFCSLCNRHSLSSKDLSEFICLLDKHVNKPEENRKKKLESCEIDAREAKRSRIC